MKFLADIPIGRATTAYLQKHGHDCVRVADRLLPTASDSEIVRLAAIENRVIICFDLGMASIVALSGHKLPSVITFRTKRQSAEVINAKLDAILPALSADLENGVLATVEDRRVRVRRLPVSIVSDPDA